MARLIDADEVGARIAEEKDEYPPENNYDVGYHNGMTMAQSIVLAAPTIDAEPVKHGQWVSVYGGEWYKCSECECHWRRGIVDECNVNYCPNCGAKMEVDDG